jgi:excisionase family DNA binding protein
MKDRKPKKMRPLTPTQFYILTALDGKHQKRAEIRRRAVEKSRGECGSFTNLATNLSTLTRKGWIEFDTFQRRPEDRPGLFYYHLLPAGRAALAEEVRRLELLIEKANQKLSLAKEQLSLPIPPPFEPTVLKIQSTLPSRRAIKNRVPVSVIKDSRKRKAVAALRQKSTMSVQELALCLGISRGAIYRWCQKGILEIIRPPGEHGEAGAQQVTTASVLRAIEAEEHD